MKRFRGQEEVTLSPCDSLSSMQKSWLGGSCMATLRIIHTTPKPRTMPHLNPFWKGQGHGVTPVLLPTRSAGSPLVLRHVASQLAPAKRDLASRASHAPHAQA